MPFLKHNYCAGTSVLKIQQPQNRKKFFLARGLLAKNGAEIVPPWVWAIESLLFNDFCASVLSSLIKLAQDHCWTHPAMLGTGALCFWQLLGMMLSNCPPMTGQQGRIQPQMSLVQTPQTGATSTRLLWLVPVPSVSYILQQPRPHSHILTHYWVLVHTARHTAVH